MDQIIIPQIQEISEEAGNRNLRNHFDLRAKAWHRVKSCIYNLDL